MGRFSNAIGFLTFEIGGEEIKLKPDMGDNERLMKIQSIKDDDERAIKIKDFCQDLMIRSYPEEPKDEIKLFVEMYLPEFMIEIMVAFKWITREKVDKFKGEQEKNFLRPSSLNNNEDED